MSAPNVDPRFATAATYTADGDDWGGASNKIDPGSGRKAEGFEPGMLPAEWLNWVVNLFGSWLYWIAARLGGLDGSGEWNYETARSRIMLIPINDYAAQTSTTADFTPGITGVQSQAVAIHTNSGRVSFPLNAYLRDGMVITSILAAVKPGAARTGGNVMVCDLEYTTPDFDVVTNNPVDPTAITLSGASQANSTAVQLIGGVSLSHAVQVRGTAAREYWFTVKGGNDAGTNPDKIYAIQVQVTDPGPRN